MEDKNKTLLSEFKYTQDKDDETIDLIKSDINKYLSIDFIESIKNPSKNFILKFFNEFYKTLSPSKFMICFSILIGNFDTNNDNNFKFVLNLIKEYFFSNEDVFDNAVYNFCPTGILRDIVNSKPFNKEIENELQEFLFDLIIRVKGDNSYCYNFLPDVLKKEKFWHHFIKKEYWAITYIKDPSISLQNEAVKQNLEAIFYIENPDPEIVHYCITNNPSLLKIKENPIARKGFAFLGKYKLPDDYFQNLSLEIQEKIIKTHPELAALIPNVNPDFINKTKYSNL